MIRLILRCKYAVIGVWLVLTALGVMSLKGLGDRLDYSYATPGQVGWESNQKIIRRFGIDPAFEAELALVDLPAGTSMKTDGGRMLAAAPLRAVHRAGPALYLHYAATRDPAFILDGGRASWALISCLPRTTDLARAWRDALSPR